jgi:hypothetical protein
MIPISQDTILISSADTEIKKRGFRIKPYNDNMIVKMLPLLKESDLGSA